MTKHNPMLNGTRKHPATPDNILIKQLLNNYTRQRMNPPIDPKEEVNRQLYEAALEYHEFPTPGKSVLRPPSS